MIVSKDFINAHVWIIFYVMRRLASIHSIMCVRLDRVALSCWLARMTNIIYNKVAILRFQSNNVHMKSSDAQRVTQKRSKTYYTPCTYYWMVDFDIQFYLFRLLFFRIRNTKLLVLENDSHFWNVDWSRNRNITTFQNKSHSSFCNFLSLSSLSCFISHNFWKNYLFIITEINQAFQIPKTFMICSKLLGFCWIPSILCS